MVERHAEHRGLHVGTHVNDWVSVYPRLQVVHEVEEQVKQFGAQSAQVWFDAR